MLSVLNRFSIRHSATVYEIQSSNRLQLMQKNGQLNGMLTETRITAIHGASDHEAIDKVLPSLGALQNECCQTGGTTNITRVFTTNVNVVDFMSCYYLNLGSSNKKLNELSDKV